MLRVFLGDRPLPKRGHTVDGLDLFRVVLFKDHSPGFEFCHGGLDVGSVPGHLGMGSAPMQVEAMGTIALSLPRRGGPSQPT
jgi:hypothetical protein